MKHLSKILALILAVMMLASVLAACGDSDSKDESKSDSKADTSTNANNDSSTEANADDDGDLASHFINAGEDQTWGNITVNVPADMVLTGGSLIDEADPNSFRLTDQNESNYFNYINVYLVDDEDEAISNIELTKEINEDCNPSEVSCYSYNSDVQWNGIEYDSMGYHCANVYGTVNGKVFQVMSCGYYVLESDEGISANENLHIVLSSLK